MNIDVFNGDADGICALVQLRLAFPAKSTLVTGVKRDIGLLTRVSAQADDLVTVLDVSFEKNCQAALQLLNKGVRIFYMDHHFPGKTPVHSGLTAQIDTDANICTSLLMDTYLGKRHTAWAVAGAFGDNLDDAAYRAARAIDLTAQQLLDIKQLGMCINYNAYGNSIADLHIAPDILFRHLEGYASPLAFMADKVEIYKQLLNGYTEDMRLARTVVALHQTDKIAVFELPDEKWARRASGVLGNELANNFPDRAHAILSHNQQGGYQVSVRAPITNKIGADELCAEFSGGGRKAAAGINHLECDQLTRFLMTFKAQYQ